jgi:hypothetical protein
MSVDGRLSNPEIHSISIGDSPIDEGCDPDSNETIERVTLTEKQSPPIMITDEGLEIEKSDGQFAKAESPILKT